MCARILTTPDPKLSSQCHKSNLVWYSPVCNLALDSLPWDKCNPAWESDSLLWGSASLLWDTSNKWVSQWRWGSSTNNNSSTRNNPTSSVGIEMLISFI